MFRQKKWSFTGASGAKYDFSILSKSEGLPEEPGIFVQAYVHLRGHLAGWQVTPLFIGHGDNLCSDLAGEMALDNDQRYLWNSNFVLLESDAAAREALCARS